MTVAVVGVWNRRSNAPATLLVQASFGTRPKVPLVPLT
jgi:hypothetical protein